MAVGDPMDCALLAPCQAREIEAVVDNLDAIDSQLTRSIIQSTVGFDVDSVLVELGSATDWPPEDSRRVLVVAVHQASVSANAESMRVESGNEHLPEMALAAVSLTMCATCRGHTLGQIGLLDDLGRNVLGVEHLRDGEPTQEQG
jgi:hypothetical protein